MAQMDSFRSTVVVTLSANVMYVYICTIVVVGVCIVTCSPCYNNVSSIICNVTCGASIGRDGQLELNSCGYTIT